MSYHDEPRYDAGYRDSLKHTIEHIENRLREEKLYGNLWLDKIEYEAYIRALSDVKNYLLWVLNGRKDN